MSILTSVIIVIALVPIFREKRYKKQCERILRTQIRINLSELISSFKDKLKHIEINPTITTFRKFKSQDIIAITNLENLLENAQSLTDSELKFFAKLMEQYQTYTFPHLKKGIDKEGIENMKKTAEQLMSKLEENWG